MGTATGQPEHAWPKQLFCLMAACDQDLSPSSLEPWHAVTSASDDEPPADSSTRKRQRRGAPKKPRATAASPTAKPKPKRKANKSAGKPQAGKPAAKKSKTEEAAQGFASSQDSMPAAQHTSNSEAEETQPLASPVAVAEPSAHRSPRPEQSSAQGYASWACARLSALQRRNICARPRRFLSFCTGMATEVLAADAIARGLQLQGNTMEVQHVAGCELDEKKRAFLIQHFGEYGSVFRDVTDMANQYVLDEKTHESVLRPEADVLVTGFSCKDISGLTTKPKSERGDNHGTSANTLRGTLRYIQACAWESRPDMVVLENVRASGELHCTLALRCAQRASLACLSSS
jgi:hypothetical protein